TAHQRLIGHAHTEAPDVCGVEEVALVTLSELLLARSKASRDLTDTAGREQLDQRAFDAEQLVERARRPLGLVLPRRLDTLGRQRVELIEQTLGLRPGCLQRSLHQLLDDSAASAQCLLGDRHGSCRTTLV